MSHISVKRFYKILITLYGTTQSFNRTAAYLPNPEESEMSSADEETNADGEYEFTESEYLDGSDDGENSENEIDLSPETYVTTSLKTKETELNINNFRWRKRNPMPVQSLFTGSEFSEPPVEEMSPREYFDMISL